jgi:hypothetical protein
LRHKRHTRPTRVLRRCARYAQLPTPPVSPHLLTGLPPSRRALRWTIYTWITKPIYVTTVHVADTVPTVHRAAALDD